VLPANLLDNANASEDKGLGYNASTKAATRASRQQSRQQRPAGVSTWPQLYNVQTSSF